MYSIAWRRVDTTTVN